jgi:DNA-binding NtrC family response regulator
MTPKKPGNGGEHQKHRKRNKGPIHQYTQEQLSRALHEIKVNGMPKSKASKQFGIPRTTLRDKVSAKTSENIEREEMYLREGN